MIELLHQDAEQDQDAEHQEDGGQPAAVPGLAEVRDPVLVHLEVGVGTVGMPKLPADVPADQQDDKRN